MMPDMNVILGELKKGDGVHWEMALGELHSSFNEAPFWILVDQVEDARNAAEAFSKVIEPHARAVPEIKFTVSFSCIQNNKKIFVDYLEGDEIFNQEYVQRIGTLFEEDELGEHDIFVDERKRRSNNA